MPRSSVRNARLSLLLLASVAACARAPSAESTRGAVPASAPVAPGAGAAEKPQATATPAAAPVATAERAPTGLGAAAADDWTPQAAWQGTKGEAAKAQPTRKAAAAVAAPPDRNRAAAEEKREAASPPAAPAATGKANERVTAEAAAEAPAVAGAQAKPKESEPRAVARDAAEPMPDAPDDLRGPTWKTPELQKGDLKGSGRAGLAMRPGQSIHLGQAGHLAHVAARPSRPPHSDRTYRPLPPPPAQWPRDARYRSTYLPGRGYLAHLATWLQRAPHPDLRLDPHGSPVPGLPSPRDRALDVTLDQDRGLLPPEGGVTTLRVRLRATDVGAKTGRVPLRLHLVLDSSGSMRGASWRAVCAAVRETARVLQPQDLLSVVHYGDHAQVLSPPVPGQSPQIRAVVERVCSLKVRGETNIWDGLRLGYEQARASYEPDAVNRVLLVSDGMATVGPRDLDSLTAQTVRALGDGITTSALGVGADFDALLMGRVALDGGGNDHFVRDPVAVPAVLGDELDVLAQEAAEAVDLRVRLPDDVDLLDVVGSEPLTDAQADRVRDVEVRADQRLARDQGIAMDRQKDVQGGVRMLFPSFRLGDEHAVLLVVRMPPGAGARPIADVELRYKDRLARRNVKLAGTRMVLYAPTRQAADTARSDDVVAAEAKARAAMALQRASEYLDPANLPRIRLELQQAATQVRAAADLTGRADLHAEAGVLRDLATAMVPEVNGPQYAWLATRMHYEWRYCGVTAWRE